MTHVHTTPAAHAHTAALPATPAAPAAPAAAPLSLPPAPAPAPAFLTARQLAAALGVSRRTLTTWTRRSVIPSVSVGRVRRYELEQVREALRASASPSSQANTSAS